jgi:flagellar motor switch protein FliN/FliY
MADEMAESWGEKPNDAGSGSAGEADAKIPPGEGGGGEIKAEDVRESSSAEEHTIEDQSGGLRPMEVHAGEAGFAAEEEAESASTPDGPVDVIPQAQAEKAETQSPAMGASGAGGREPLYAGAFSRASAPEATPTYPEAADSAAKPGRESPGSGRAVGGDLDKPGLGLLYDVELDATLQFGSKEMLLRDVLELGPGDVVELDRHIAEPVDLVVGDRIVARGEVVVASGNFALRVTEVATPQMRLESIR